MEKTIQLAQNNNKDAFAKIYKEYVSKIYALCLRMINNKLAAEELTQDIFVRLWEKLETFKGNSKFSTWLYRLAINVILAKIKKNQLIKKRERTIDELDVSEKCAPNVKFHIKMDLEKAISLLPQREKLILLLHDVHGFKHKEISSFLKISLSSSKTILSKSRNILKEYLNEVQ